MASWKELIVVGVPCVRLAQLTLVVLLSRCVAGAAAAAIVKPNVLGLLVTEWRLGFCNRHTVTQLQAIFGYSNVIYTILGWCWDSRNREEIGTKTLDEGP